MHFLNPALSSRLLTRAMYGYVYTLLRQRGAMAEQLDDIRKEASQIKSWPRDLERQFVSARLRDFHEALGAADPTIKRILGGHTIGYMADSVATNSELADSSRFMALLDDNYLASGDVSVDLINSLAPLYFTLDQQLTNFKSREESFAARLARAQFAIYGATVPPDASFSLRIADGVVSGYAYNGTVAPAFTTFYGLLDQHYSHPGAEEWALPLRWVRPVKDLRYETQLNLVSTNDITGGNSGSPLLNDNLEIVGLVFDGNIESLPNQFLFTDKVARAVSVDSRGILEALHSVYDTDRIVQEIRQGRVFTTESAADESVSEIESSK
jgi:Peptidase S46